LTNISRYNRTPARPFKAFLSFSVDQRYMEITHDPFLFNVAQGIFWLFSERLSRCTLHLIEWGEGSLHSCTL